MSTVCVDSDDFTTDSSGRLQIKKGCGLTSSDDGIAINADDWPFEDCSESSGEDVYCDPSTGRLVTRPRPHLDCLSVTDSNGDNVNIVNEGDTRIIMVEADIDATDWCGTDSVCVNLSIGGSWAVGMLAPGAGYRVDVQESLDGAAWQDIYFGVDGMTNSPNVQTRYGNFFGPRVFNITPNAVFNYRVRVVITSLDAADITVFSIAAKMAGTFATANP